MARAWRKRWAKFKSITIKKAVLAFNSKGLNDL